MSSHSFDPARALEALLDHGVGFVVIGGLAARAHGSSSLTNDLAIVSARDDANLERLANVLTDLEAALRGAPDDLPFLLDATTLARGDSFTFTTKYGNLDVLGTPSGTDGYGDLRRGAVPMGLGGHEVLMASLDDLIRMKDAAGRAKDRAEVEILVALREERDREA